MTDYYVYIVANQRNGTLYTGVTSNLIQRMHEHRNSFIESFTKKYKIDKLVYYEVHSDIYEAIIREKRIKRWYRKWKIELIEASNRNWQDLYSSIIQ